MALPTSDQLLSLDYDDRGLPFVWVEAKSLTTESLDYDDRGLPFVGATGAAVTPDPVQAASRNHLSLTKSLQLGI